MRQGLMLEAVRIRGVQLDLVVTEFFFICNWLKFCKYKFG